MLNLILSLLGGLTFAVVLTKLLGLIFKKAAGSLWIFISIPLFLIFLYNGFEISSRQLFMTDKDGTVGEVLLQASPLKVPAGTSSPVDYCGQFVDLKNEPIRSTSNFEGQIYCGKFYLGLAHLGMGIPYIERPDGKIVYWVSATESIVR